MRFADTEAQTSSSKGEGRDDWETLQKGVSSPSLNLPEGSEKKWRFKDGSDPGQTAIWYHYWKKLECWFYRQQWVKLIIFPKFLVFLTNDPSLYYFFLWQSIFCISQGLVLDVLFFFPILFPIVSASILIVSILICTFTILNSISTSSLSPEFSIYSTVLRLPLGDTSSISY